MLLRCMVVITLCSSVDSTLDHLHAAGMTWFYGVAPRKGIAWPAGVAISESATGVATVITVC